MTFIAERPVEGTDEAGDAVAVGISGKAQDELRTSDAHSHLLAEILTQMKIANQYLLILAGYENEVFESDAEIPE